MDLKGHRQTNLQGERDSWGTVQSEIYDPSFQDSAEVRESKIVYVEHIFMQRGVASLSQPSQEFSMLARTEI